MDVNKIKKDFPILARKVNDHDLVYLDNAATSQKPSSVLEAISDFYRNNNANVHRGLHTLSEESTDLYDAARKKVAEFIGARKPEEIIFTKNATESLNRVAISWGLANLKEGDVVLLTDYEHHSNLVPWQEEVAMVGAKIEYLDSGENGEISLEQVKEKLHDRVKLISVSHASNVLGTIAPIKEISKLAHEKDIKVCVDGAQAVPHMKVNVQSLDCDFYAFSGHKMLGPTGIGVLYVKEEILKDLEPYEYGGGMIKEVTYEKSTYALAPEKYEAGTPNIGGAVGLMAAIDYLENTGMENIRTHEIELNEYALRELGKMENINIIGPLDSEKRTGLISFTLEGIHSHDVASVLNSEGIAVRSGHHCTMPLHKKLGLPGTVRASWYLYNTKEEIDKLADGLKKAKELLG